MGAITIFWKNGLPVGTCPAGQEVQFLNPDKGMQSERPDRQTSSTDERWQKWAWARGDKKYGGGGMSEQEAQRYL